MKGVKTRNLTIVAVKVRLKCEKRLSTVEVSEILVVFAADLSRKPFNLVNTLHSDSLSAVGLLARLCCLMSCGYIQSSKQSRGSRNGSLCGVCYWFVVKCY